MMLVTARQVNRRAAPHRLLRIEASELAADEMSLVEQETVLGRQLIDANQHAVLDAISDCPQSLRAPATGCAVARHRGRAA